MDAIYIPRLMTLPERTETVEGQDFSTDLETLTPIQGQVQVKHCGNYLDVAAQADTIVTLTCHRCLQKFNHRLSVSASEMIWLQDEVPDVDVIPFDRDLDMEDLMETVAPDGYFDVSTWLYEQLCLAIPLRQLCDQHCQGIPLPTLEAQYQIDRRWASLQTLKAGIFSKDDSK
jgi:uncharacterized protein